eukprot:7379915-Prymnesium_polylepis.1
MRKQMRGRLVHWRRKLLECPGASMNAQAARSLPRPAAQTWVIGGDAASDGDPRQGLGAFWYGLLWRVPLGDVPGLADLHIVNLELIEIGLGVVTVGPLCYGAPHVQLKCDALVATLAMRAERDDGRRAREARAPQLVAIHEVIINTPEWCELVRTVDTLEVVQAYGETMLLHDAASRGYDAVIDDVCAAIGVKPRRLDPLPARSMNFLHAA